MLDSADRVTVRGSADRKANIYTAEAGYLARLVRIVFVRSSSRFNALARGLPVWSSLGSGVESLNAIAAPRRGASAATRNIGKAGDQIRDHRGAGDGSFCTHAHCCRLQCQREYHNFPYCARPHHRQASLLNSATLTIKGMGTVQLQGAG